MTLAVNIAQGGSNNVTFRNRIINGGMVIDQRNAGASLTTNGAYTLDRWYFETSNTGNNSVQQVADAPTGFYNSLKITNTTGGSIVAGTYQDFVQKIEGFNVADLGYGTASASTLTASFWVKTSVTGTYGVSLRLPLIGTPAGITQAFTISSANTWTQVSVQFSGYQSGSITASNTGQLSLYFHLSAGSTNQATAGSWTTSNGGFVAPSTISNTFFTTSSATWQVTGVQLEAGTTASPFEYRQYGTELALCQRYYAKLGANTNGSSNYQAYGAGHNNSANTNQDFCLSFPQFMRASPTIAFSGGVGVSVNGSYTNASIASTYVGVSSCLLQTNTSAIGTSGQGAVLLSNADSTAYISITAEL